MCAFILTKVIMIHLRIMKTLKIKNRREIKKLEKGTGDMKSRRILWMTLAEIIWISSNFVSILTIQVSEDNTS